MEDNKQIHEGEESDLGGEASSVVAIIPKKRGRPKKLDKVQKPPPSGRGRGRPAKNATIEKAPERVNNAKPSVPNGSGRGRPPKQGKAKKVQHPITATGRGRGRPKNPPKSEPEDSDADDDDNVSDYRPGGGNSPKKGKKEQAKPPSKRGRPKKVETEDSGSDSERQPEEHRPIGRPATGGVNLNINRTERGQGRPKTVHPEKRGAEDSNGDVVKKRGRPALLKPKPRVEVEDFISADEDENINQVNDSSEDDNAL